MVQPERGGRGRGKGRSPSLASFPQLFSGQTQEKLPPPALLKLVNQVHPGGAGEERAGPKGGGPIGRSEELGGGTWAGVQKLPGSELPL